MLPPKVALDSRNYPEQPATDSGRYLSVFDLVPDFF